MKIKEYIIESAKVDLTRGNLYWLWYFHTPILILVSNYFNIWVILNLLISSIFIFFSLLYIHLWQKRLNEVIDNAQNDIINNINNKLKKEWLELNIELIK